MSLKGNVAVLNGYIYISIYSVNVLIVQLLLLRIWVNYFILALKWCVLRPGKMAQWETSLLCKQKCMGLDLQHYHIKLGVAVSTCISILESGDRTIPGAAGQLG